jgi:hypothetical protein
MNEHSEETYLEPHLECDQELIDPMSDAGVAPAPTLNINVCNSHC